MKNSKLFISLSFDDGRKDTYKIAYKIMKKYNLVGTIHVITGYIDKSYTKTLASSYGACSINDLVEMKNDGFEISLHGDQHKCETKDLLIAIKKLKKWKLINKTYGFSVPYSNEKSLININLKESKELLNLKYIRVGKNYDRINLFYKIIYILYRIINNDYFYYKYNKNNINMLGKYDKNKIHSIVVRRSDTVNMLKIIINNNINKNTWIVFMFHSIFEEKHHKDIISDWVWDINNFEQLCSYLKDLKDDKKIEVKTIIDVVMKEKKYV